MSRTRERVAFWTKDGAWHTSEIYVPTAEDRRRYPVSYPEGDDGPFYVWTEDAYDSEEEALAKLKGETRCNS